MNKQEIKTFWNRLFGFRSGIRVQVKPNPYEPLDYYQDKLERGIRTGIIVQSYIRYTGNHYWIIKLDDGSLGTYEEKSLVIL